MAQEKPSLSAWLPAAAEGGGERTRPVDIFGTDYQVPTSFAPQWLGNVEPLLPIFKNMFGSTLADLNLEDANVSELMKSNATGQIKVGDMLDELLEPDNWTLVRSCLGGLLADVFGDQTPALLALNLGITEWVALGKMLGAIWGVGLGELRRLPSSSAAVGTTSKATSKGSTASTRRKRSGNPATRATSASAG